MRRACPVANLLLAVSMILGLAGCAQSGPINARPADYLMPGMPATQPSRRGRVYVLRGFGDVFSAGMDTITEDLQEKGVVATVHRHDRWHEIGQQIVLDQATRMMGRLQAREPSVGTPDPVPPPLVLIGHSWGADDCIRLARYLDEHGVRVDLLITVEAVTPPAVPSNVLRAWNIYKPGPLDFLPWWRGVPLKVDRPDKTRLTQIDISRDWPAVDHWWVGHTDIDNLPAVQDRIVSMVMDACPLLSAVAAREADSESKIQERIYKQQLDELTEHSTTRPGATGGQDVPDAH
jgi:pimeloyl-ACP methyl ester carboxylesterase